MTEEVLERAGALLRANTLFSVRLAQRPMRVGYLTAGKIIHWREQRAVLKGMSDESESGCNL